MAPSSKSHAFGLGDHRPRAKHVVILTLDLFENLQAAAAEKFQIDRQAAVHLPRQRQPLRNNSRATPTASFIARAETIVEAPGEQILDRIAVPLQHIQRKIDAVFLQIDDHVLPEIRELQRGASGVGERLPLRVLVAAQSQHQPPHRDSPNSGSTRTAPRNCDSG